MSKLVIGFFLICAAFPEWPANAIERGQSFIMMVQLNDSLETFTESR